MLNEYSNIFCATQQPFLEQWFPCSAWFSVCRSDKLMHPHISSVQLPPREGPPGTTAVCHTAVIRQNLASPGRDEALPAWCSSPLSARAESGNPGSSVIPDSTRQELPASPEQLWPQLWASFPCLGWLQIRIAGGSKDWPLKTDFLFSVCLCYSVFLK